MCVCVFFFDVVVSVEVVLGRHGRRWMPEADTSNAVEEDSNANNSGCLAALQKGCIATTAAFVCIFVPTRSRLTRDGLYIKVFVSFQPWFLVLRCAFAHGNPGNKL